MRLSNGKIGYGLVQSKGHSKSQDTLITSSKSRPGSGGQGSLDSNESKPKLARLTSGPKRPQELDKSKDTLSPAQNRLSGHMRSKSDDGLGDIRKKSPKQNESQEISSVKKKSSPGVTKSQSFPHSQPPGNFMPFFDS